jgi:hypothetical protein
LGVDLLIPDVMGRVLSAFRTIPTNDLLHIGLQVQHRLHRGELKAEQKPGDELVTQADRLIQQRLVQHFESCLEGLAYGILAEEDLSYDSAQSPDGVLVIDPLDGTSSFVRGEPTWGVMVGWVSSRGCLEISWNLLSSGQVYTSLAPSFAHPPKFTGARCLIDVWDYDSGAREQFSQILRSVNEPARVLKNIGTTAYPAAVWVGWQLLEGGLDGLLWLPGTRGKRCYPEYDLIMLGTLVVAGWHVCLGRSKDGAVQVVLVASDAELGELLLDTANVWIRQSQVADLDQLRFQHVRAGDGGIAEFLAMSSPAAQE